MRDGDHKSPATARLCGGGDGKRRGSARRYGDHGVAREVAECGHGPRSRRSVVLCGPVDAGRLGCSTGQDDRDAALVKAERAGKLSRIFRRRKARRTCAHINQPPPARHIAASIRAAVRISPEAATTDSTARRYDASSASANNASSIIMMLAQSRHLSLLLPKSAPRKYQW